ncbi:MULTISPECIES: TadE/TadG family type IV pilus assembly protein [unclassified Paenibacillus]|uniref:TadE/TadG family type IV pilus assembly protein n=1 Tax=unclassified Paenibacillus TaxID=185978 RepID=UPI0030FC35FC
MKQWQSLTRQRDEGSMVVEAAMVLPMFLLFVLFLIFIVQMTLYSTALQSTASDTVKVISAHMYPAALAAQKWGEEQGADSGTAGQPAAAGSTGGSIGREADTAAPINAGVAGGTSPLSSGTWSIPRLSLEQWGESFAADLPEPLNEWVNAAIQRGEGPLQELQAEASQSVLDLALKPIMKPYLSSDWLDYERIHVSNAIIPELKRGARPYFGLVVSYELPMKVPFLNRSIVLEASAVERLWIGDTGETGTEGDGGAGEEQHSIVVLAKPNPGVANHQGKIRVKVPPNASANLSIFYKSGQSTAKYLGWKQADEGGYIEWEWKIGVNTTPGSWPFVVRLDDGTFLEAAFTVVK